MIALFCWIWPAHRARPLSVVVDASHPPFRRVENIMQGKFESQFKHRDERILNIVRKKAMRPSAKAYACLDIRKQSGLDDRRLRRRHTDRERGFGKPARMTTVRFGGHRSSAGGPGAAVRSDLVERPEARESEGVGDKSGSDFSCDATPLTVVGVDEIAARMSAPFEARRYDGSKRTAFLCRVAMPDVMHPKMPAACNDASTV